MSELANLGVGGSAAINLANNRLARRAAHIIKPGGNHNFGGRLDQIAKGHKIGVELRRGPVFILQFGGLRRSLRRIKAGADEVKNAAELQVVANNLRKELRMRFGVIPSWRKVSDRHARLGDVAKPSSLTKPWRTLRVGGDSKNGIGNNEGQKSEMLY